ncbi:MAG TPA: arabinofuranosidase catalytic domain-containing protein [Polyangiaceae bacterium]
MRIGLIGIMGVSVLASATFSAGCSSYGSSGGAGGSANSGNPSGGTGNGGATGNGGTLGKGGAIGVGGNTVGSTGKCTSVTPCGGNVVGTWNVTTSCLTLSGDYDVALGGLGCATIPVTGSLQTTGSLIVKGDGTYTDNTTTTGTISFPLAENCRSISSVSTSCTKMANIFTALGWASAACTDTNGQCNCTATANQSGGLGMISPIVSTSGAYTTSGSTLTTDDVLKYSYCVSGSNNTLTVTPQQGALSGTVVFQKEGTTGTGGAPGSGGAMSTGGSVGAGGQSGSSGGKTGTGGAAAGGTSAGGALTGGATSVGGGSAGGKTGAGGAATGGTSAVGGTAGATSVNGGTSATGGTTSTSTIKGPCDIFAAANTTCVAAHSTIRALLGSYTGNLYQVKRASDNTLKDIPVGVGGFADSAVQDSFCTGTTCTIIRVYDQTGHGNFVEAETPDSTVQGHSGMTAAKATAETLTVSGHKVYSLYTTTSQAYWRDGSKSGMPLGAAPQGIYMVTSGKHYNSGCCYDYGNGETTRTYVAGPSMDAVYFGNNTIWGTGAGNGPWIMADMEDGMTAGGSGKNNNNPSQTATYVTAIEKNNGTTEWALRGGDATTGALGTYYKGALPAGKNPMKKQGSIVLGSGGDCCYSNNNASAGTFYEGAIVSGYPSDATEDAVQANIISAGYGK